MSIQIFAKQFNEENWIDYYLMSKKYFVRLPGSIKSSLEDIVIPEDIKIVIIYRLKEYASDWLNSGLPLISGIKPIELLESEEGTKALKEILLRMPS